MRRGRPPVIASERTALGAWIVEHGLTQREAAAQLGLHPVYLGRIATGKQLPSADVMWRIEQLTEGAVRMQSWFSS